MLCIPSQHNINIVMAVKLELCHWTLVKRVLNKCSKSSNTPSYNKFTLNNRPSSWVWHAKYLT